MFKKRKIRSFRHLSCNLITLSIFPAPLHSHEANCEFKRRQRKQHPKIKFLYSYGGKILPRRTDGVLRYVGGHTRVLSVDRSITFADLMVRFLELCGSSMTLKCKLPIEDLDVLVNVTSDEELVTIIEEYNRFSSSTNKDLKIVAVLFPMKSLKTISPPPSTVSSLDFSSVILRSPDFWRVQGKTVAKNKIHRSLYEYESFK